MVWQKVVDHIHDERIVVESKSGNRYPVDLDYKSDGESVYSHMMNEKNDWDLWADVDFDGDSPTADHVQTGHPSGGPPTEKV